MIIFLRRFFMDGTGALAPMTAVMLPLLLGMMGIGVDVGFWMKNRRDLQAAADAAVIAAAWEIANDFSEDFAETAALKEAVNNGYSNVEGNSLDVTFGEDDDGNTTVTAVLTSKDDKYFSKALYNGDIYSTVAAATAVILPNDEFCMLSLAPTGTSMTFNGTADLDFEGCGLAVNSADDNAALVVNGSPTLDVDEVSTVGGMSEADKEEFPEDTDINTGVDPFDDPYADLDIPDYDECTEDEMDDGPLIADDEDDLPGADGNGVTVICGGLKVKNGDELDLPPGIYIIDGGDLNIQGELTGDGVTLILTNSGGDDYGDFGDVNFSGDVDISAPTPDDGVDDDWEDFVGLAIYQDRNAPSQVQCNDLRGNTSVLVDGAMYFPSRCLDIGGGSDEDAENTCSRIIALTITLHGNPNMGNSCEGKGVEDILGGEMQIKLIL